MIADFDYYVNQYKGIAIESADVYDYFAERASERLAPYPLELVCDVDALKRCACRVADILYSADKSNKSSGGKASESVSGYYTVTYSTVDEAQIDKSIANAVMLYIGKYITGATRYVKY